MAKANAGTLETHEEVEVFRESDALAKGAETKKHIALAIEHVGVNAEPNNP